MKSDLPAVVTDALDQTGLPWTVERGSRHLKILIAGQPVAVFPHRPGKRDDIAKRRADLNTVSRIRRLARVIKEKEHA